MRWTIILGVVLLHLAPPGRAELQPPALDAVERAARDAAAYLVRSTRPDGSFRYRAGPQADGAPASDYNVLRHAGTLYAMADYYRRHPDPALKAAVLRAARFLEDKTLRPLPGRLDTLAVWSVPEIVGEDRPLQAKLGGAGLGLVALLSVEDIAPGTTALPRLRALGRFLLYMQEPNGRFVSKYIPARGGRWDEWQSLFYPGEAALGLIMLYERDSSEAWLAGARGALTYLARSREHDPEVPADHWALLATARLLSLGPPQGSPDPQALLVRHAARICETMLRSQIPRERHPHLRGGFSATGETVRTAVYLEGLQAALTFLPRDDPARKAVQAAVPRGIAFLLRAQITSGPLAGAFPEAIGGRTGHGRAAEASDDGRGEVRIDYVQHALSALLAYLRQAGFADPAADTADQAPEPAGRRLAATPHRFSMRLRRTGPASLSGLRPP